MFRSEKQGLAPLFRVAWPFLVLTGSYAGLFFSLEEILGDQLYKMSGQVGSVLSLVVAFFLGFRMNAAYDRWWEARKIAGELTNNTRSFIASVYAHVYHAPHRLQQSSLAPQQARRLVDMTLYYVQQLGAEIQETPADILPITEHTYQQYGIDTQQKLSQEWLLALSLEIEHIWRSAPLEKYHLLQHIQQFYDIQGKAERIKNTPFLHVYSAFAGVMVSIYTAMMPLFVGDIDLGGEESVLEWLSVPILVLISTSFLTIQRLANLLAEPFANNETAVPFYGICKQIIVSGQQLRQKMV